jgi:hypothetical protein
VIGRDAQAGLWASDAVFEWCLRGAQRAEHLGELEGAALWAHIAANVAWEHGHSRLCSPPLEALLARLAPGVAPGSAASDASSSPLGWLHVLTMSYAIGGHTALARRWIAADAFGSRHSLVLTTQAAQEVEPGLGRAVAASGGAVLSLAGEGGLLRRAQRLRQLAAACQVVVVHSHPWDIVPSLAFAAPGGPPVLLMNHADHAFWVGARIADVIVDIRDSGLALSRAYRGAQRSALLPVPLEDHGPAPHDRSLAMAKVPDRALLAAADPLILTIGRPHKYRRHPCLDFAGTLTRIVESLPRCVVVAVGPARDDPTWRALRESSDGRVFAVGTDADLAPWHAAADLYIEGFPIGSYTALLEVALAKRAFVRKPWLAPPDELPVDRGALAGFEPPASPDAYAERTLALAHDPDLRAREAVAARDAVRDLHCGEAWAAQLDALRRSLPAHHEPAEIGDLPPLSPGLAAYHSGLYAALAEAPLEFARRWAESNRLRARTDTMLLDALRRVDGGADQAESAL